MSDPRYPGDPSQPAQPQQQPPEWAPESPQQPSEWQQQQPMQPQPGWQPQQDAGWQPQPTQQSEWQQQQPMQPQPGWQPQQNAGWQPQQVSGWQPPAAPPKKGRTWLRTAIVLGVVALLVVGFIVVRDRLPSSVSDLAPGECIDKPASTDAISEVPRQPCNDPHDGEVFAVIRHTAAGGAPYPSLSAFEQLVSEQCLSQVQTYTGRSLAEIDAAGLDYSYFYPTSSSWSDGDRGITCFITRRDNGKMIGSVRASAPGTTGPAATP